LHERSDLLITETSNALFLRDSTVIESPTLPTHRMAVLGNQDSVHKSELLALVTSRRANELSPPSQIFQLEHPAGKESLVKISTGRAQRR
jgi:hypothetical protein